MAKYFQSKQIVDYLVEGLEENRNDYEVLSALYFLQYCTEFYGKEGILLDIIKESYISSEVKEDIVVRAIKVIAWISSMNQTGSTPEIISIIKSDVRVEILGATCGLIAETNTSDEHSEYLLEKLKNATELQESYSAQQNLVEAIGTFNGIDNILKSIRTLIEQEGYVRLFRKDRLFSTLIGKLCSNQEIKSEDIIEQLVQIFIMCSRQHRSFELKVIKECFKHFDVKEKAFLMLISHSLNDLDMLFCIEEIMEEELIPTLLDCYNDDKIKDDVLKWYARRLPEESLVYLAINKAVMKKEGSAIEREVKVDWEKLRRDGTQKYFDSLIDKEAFTSLIKELNQYYDEGTLCENLLKESFNKIPTNREDLDYAVRAVFNSGLDKTTLLNFINEVDWELFSMDSIIHTLEQNKNLIVSQQQKQLIEKYYLKMIKETNFEMDPLSQNTQFIAEQIVFLIEYFNFEISDEKLLEFLVLPWYVFKNSSVSSESETLKYVEQKIKDKQKLHEKVILNLQKEALNPYAIQAHIFYCLENELTNAIDVATKFLKDRDKDNSFLQNSAIEYLIAIEGEGYVDNLVDENMDIHLLKYLAIKLRVENKKLISVLIRKNQESENKLIYLEELVNLNSEYALRAYLKLAKDINTIPDKHSDSARVSEITDAIRKIRDIKLLEYIGDLFVLSMSEGFEDADHGGLFSSTWVAIENLVQIDANKVRVKLDELIEHNSENNKIKSHCNYHLNSIEKQLDVSNDKPWDMKTSLEFIKKISDNTIIL